MTGTELLERAVFLARWDIAHGREPDSEAAMAAGFVTTFAPITDPAAEDAKAKIMEMAVKYGLVDDDSGEFDSELMHQFLMVAEAAFWAGLTRGDVMLHGTPDISYRLFPELRGTIG